MLLFAAHVSRRDIQFAGDMVSRLNTNAVKRTMRYIRGTVGKTTGKMTGKMIRRDLMFFGSWLWEQQEAAGSSTLHDGAKKYMKTIAILNLSNTFHTRLDTM